jgi:hypothetical protein
LRRQGCSTFRKYTKIRSFQYKCQWFLLQMENFNIQKHTFYQNLLPISLRINK